MHFAAINSYLFTLHSFFVVLGLIIYGVTSHIRKQRRHPSASIAWIVLLFLLPYLALPMYLLIGTRKVLVQRPWRTVGSTSQAAHHNENSAAIFQNLACAMQLPAAMSYGQLFIHADGQDALKRLRLTIEGAVQTLDVCTFLIGDDVLGDEIVDMLIKKARSGVQVRLLVDGLGIYFGGKLGFRKLSSAGVRVELFGSPWRLPFMGRINLRNHRKMVIADGERTWSGGRNLAAEYFIGDAASKPPKSAWVDLSFDFGEDLARQSQWQFNQDWEFAIQSSKSNVFLPLEDSGLITKGGAQFIASGPDQLDDTVYLLLISSCFRAKSRILAVTPYFVPDATLLMALTLAARRGVKVDLLLPHKSNHLLADIARHNALREMSNAGAQIWLLPKMIHAKAIIFDDEIVLTGSANLDERSLFLNYEMMIAFFQPNEINLFAQWIENQKKFGKPYLSKPVNVYRDFVEGLVRWVAFQL